MDIKIEMQSPPEENQLTSSPISHKKDEKLNEQILNVLIAIYGFFALVTLIIILADPTRSSTVNELCALTGILMFFCIILRLTSPCPLHVAYWIGIFLMVITTIFIAESSVFPALSVPKQAVAGILLSSFLCVACIRNTCWKTDAIICWICIIYIYLRLNVFSTQSKLIFTN